MKTYWQILGNWSPSHAVAIGKQTTGYDDSWSPVCYKVMSLAVKEKVLQNPNVLSCLLETKNKVLVFSGADETFWGNGLDITDCDSTDMLKWNGANKLGCLLMSIRSEIMVELAI